MLDFIKYASSEIYLGGQDFVLKRAISPDEEMMYQPSLRCSSLSVVEASLMVIVWRAFCHDGYGFEISILTCLGWENVCVS